MKVQNQLHWSSNTLPHQLDIDAVFAWQGFGMLRTIDKYRVYVCLNQLNSVGWQLNCTCPV